MNGAPGFCGEWATLAPPSELRSPEYGAGLIDWNQVGPDALGVSQLIGEVTRAALAAANDFYAANDHPVRQVSCRLVQLEPDGVVCLTRSHRRVDVYAFPYVCGDSPKLVLLGATQDLFDKGLLDAYSSCNGRHTNLMSLVPRLSERDSRVGRVCTPAAMGRAEARGARDS